MENNVTWIKDILKNHDAELSDDKIGELAKSISDALGKKAQEAYRTETVKHEYEHVLEYTRNGVFAQKTNNDHDLMMRIGNGKASFAGDDKGNPIRMLEKTMEHPEDYGLSLEDFATIVCRLDRTLAMNQARQAMSLSEDAASSE